MMELQFDSAELLALVPAKMRPGLADVLARISTDAAWRDVRHVAYFLATVQWETAQSYQPVREFGRGRGRRYGRLIRGHAYYGRGYVQLTWEANYRRCGQLIGLGDALVANPDLALRPDVSYSIAAEGMRRGWFTGRKLNDFITGNKCDYVGARRIINGLDRAEKIAELAERIEVRLRQALVTVSPEASEVRDSTIAAPGGAMPVWDVVTQPAQPKSSKRWDRLKALVTSIAGIVYSTAASAWAWLQGVDPRWVFLIAVLAVVVFGGLYLHRQTRLGEIRELR